jgi:hypothetical protein
MNQNKEKIYVCGCCKEQIIGGLVFEEAFPPRRKLCKDCKDSIYYLKK